MPLHHTTHIGLLVTTTYHTPFSSPPSLLQCFSLQVFYAPINSAHDFFSRYRGSERFSDFFEAFFKASLARTIAKPRKKDWEVQIHIRREWGPGKMAQQLRAPATPLEYWSLSSNTHNSLELWIHGIWWPLLASVGISCPWCTYIQAHRHISFVFLKKRKIAMLMWGESCYRYQWEVWKLSQRPATCMQD